MIEMIEQLRKILIKKDQRITDLIGRVDELERTLEYYEKEEYFASSYRCDTIL